MALTVPDNGLPQKLDLNVSTRLTKATDGDKTTAASDAEAAWVVVKNAEIADPNRSFGVTALAVAASLATALSGANNDLVFTAKTAGEAGNNIIVTYVDPGGATASLGVVTTGSSIVVNLGRAASAINTTATLLKAAVDADATAAALVSVANKGADNGTGLVTALSATHLAGGKDIASR